MGQEIDYAAVLADLEARRATLDGVITVLKQMVGTGVLEAILIPSPPGTKSENANRDTVGSGALPSEVRPGVFHGLSVSEAVRKFLEMTKTKQRTVDIATALRQGGIESTADNFYGNVFTTMKRRKDFVKLGKFWALAEWYPTRAVPPVKPATKKSRVRKGGRGRKPFTADKPKVPAGQGSGGEKSETA
jgi:hypothetical protein